MANSTPDQSDMNQNQNLAPSQSSPMGSQGQKLNEPTVVSVSFIESFP